MSYKIKTKFSEKKFPRNNSRREEVYTEATKLFRKNGYLKTTMEEIAQAVKIKKGSLYYYIKDKETLLFDILDRTNDILLESLRGLSLQGLPTKEKLARLIHIHLLNVSQYRNEIPLLINEAKNLRPDLRKMVFSKRTQYEKIFFEVIEEGLSNNTFIQHDKTMVRFWILGGIFWFFQWFNPAEKRPETIEKNAEEIERDFLRLLFNGLLVKRVS